MPTFDHETSQTTRANYDQMLIEMEVIHPTAREQDTEIARAKTLKAATFDSFITIIVFIRMHFGKLAIFLYNSKEIKMSKINVAKKRALNEHKKR